MDTNDHKATNTKNVTIDLRIVVILLAAIIVTMLLLWKPWEAASNSAGRTVTVTGEATVKAEPDEFIFYPSYEFKNKDKAIALAELTQKSDQLTTKLKELGIADNKIKTNSNSDKYGWYYNETTEENIYTLQLTVTLDSLDKAQKIQDYLLTTSPSGSVSPQASFSTAKRKELENKARDEASKDARSKAEKSATNIGFKVGGVKSVTDGSGFGEIMPMERGAAIDSATATSEDKVQLQVQPGENELTYSVTVVYYIK